MMSLIRLELPGPIKSPITCFTGPMTEALFALAGVALGVLGTAITAILLSSREDRRLRRESLRTTCADFTAAIARMRFLATQIHLDGADADLTSRMRESHETATVCCERLRLVTTSMAAQEAARYALRYALGLWLQVQGRDPRADERERGPLLELNDRLRDLYIAVRRELGVAHPAEVFAEPFLQRLPTRNKSEPGNSPS